MSDKCQEVSSISCEIVSYLCGVQSNHTSMKQFFILFLMMNASVAMSAQEEAKDSTVNEPTMQLEGVTVKAARVIQTDEGMQVFPTEKQLESSPNGYSLLQKLNLPGIRVDEVMRTVTSPELIGSVQVRINDIIASKEDLYEGLFVAIRQFAKRQETWFRMMEKKGVEIKWLEPGSKEARISEACEIIHKLL